MSAILKIGGKQVTVNEGDKVKVEKLAVQPGDTVKLDSVLAVMNGEEAKFGAPFVEGAIIEAKVLKHGRHKKITVFRYKSKKRERTKTGHRQWYTELEIGKIITA
jgi:large subunit ribosomal protein L21